MVEVTVYHKEESSWDRWDLIAYQKFLAEKLEEIPEQYRECAVIEFRCENQGYDDYAVATHIYYERPQTQEEINEEARKRYAQQAAQEARERTMYENLKKKFEA